MKHSENISNIAAALVMAQAAMKNVHKDANNPFFKSKYATLENVIDQVKPALLANGIAYIQTPVTNAKEECGVETMLLHSSGEWLLGDPFFVPVSKADAQGFGSAITYMRRYSLMAVAGLAPSDDDDGNAAAQAKPEARPNTATQVAHDALAAMSDEEQKYLREWAGSVIDLFNANGDVLGYIQRNPLDNEEKLAAWSLLPSNVRAALKKAAKEAQPPHMEKAA